MLQLRHLHGCFAANVWGGRNIVVNFITRCSGSVGFTSSTQGVPTLSIPKWRMKSGVKKYWSLVIEESREESLGIPWNTDTIHQIQLSTIPMVVVLCYQSATSASCLILASANFFEFLCPAISAAAHQNMRQFAHPVLYRHCSSSSSFCRLLVYCTIASSRQLFYHHDLQHRWVTQRQFWYPGTPVPVFTRTICGPS